MSTKRKDENTRPLSHFLSSPYSIHFGALQSPVPSYSTKRLQNNTLLCRPDRLQASISLSTPLERQGTRFLTNILQHSRSSLSFSLYFSLSSRETFLAGIFSLFPSLSLSVVSKHMFRSCWSVGEGCYWVKRQKTRSPT